MYMFNKVNQNFWGFEKDEAHLSDVDIEALLEAYNRQRGNSMYQLPSFNQKALQMPNNFGTSKMTPLLPLIGETRPTRNRRRMDQGNNGDEMRTDKPVLNKGKTSWKNRNITSKGGKQRITYPGFSL